MNIKVLTFNIHHGRGRDKVLDLHRIGSVLSKTKADIIGLNEVDKHFSERSNFIDQASYLAKELKMEHVYGPAITNEDPGKHIKRQFGNALLTRFPIVASRNYPFDFLPKVIEDRALLEAKLKIGQEELNLFVTHLSLAPFLHQKQSAFILNTIRARAGASIVMGDWNMSPLSKSWKNFSEHLTDVWVETNDKHDTGYTFPSNRPKRRLDYIFISEGLKPIVSEVIYIDKNASDHLPVMTTLKLKSV